MDKPTCKTCVHWDTSDGPNSKEGTKGLCRFLCPRLLSDMIQTERNPMVEHIDDDTLSKKAIDLVHNLQMGIWPRTGQDEWCSNHTTVGQRVQRIGEKDHIVRTEYKKTFR